MEKAELEKLDIPALRALYLEESELLNQALLDGTAWEEMVDQRKKVIAIGVVIDEKSSAAKNALIVAALQVDLP